MNRYQDDVDAGVLDAIFRAKKPSQNMARLGSTISTTGDYVVYMLKLVVPGQPETIPLAERDQRKEELQGAAGALDYNAFVNELQRTTEIERNDEALATPDYLQ